MTRMLSGQALRGIIRKLRRNGCCQEGTLTRGHLSLQDGDVTVLWAIQKNRFGGWVVTFKNTARVAWFDPAITEAPAATESRDDQVGDQHGGQ